ncbi:MAG TPA: FHA domain-containing protein [Blastocatellia bacterium]|nr:FHA domain-containing protein [Blastocatellia bacterium]
MTGSVIPGRQIRLRDYRYPGEVLSLVLTFVIIAVLYALAVRFFPSSSTRAMQILIVTVAALIVYIVTVVVQQRSVIGTMVRVSPRQFPELYGLATVAAERLCAPLVPVYVRRSSEQQIYPLGFLRRTLIVITSSMVDQMPKDNLQFFIGREIGHIQAGHTWLRTMLKPVGSEVPVIGKLLNSVIFGDWINRAEYTADRAGFIACASLTTAVTGMLRYGVGISLFQQLDIREFLGQINEVRNVGGLVTDIIADQPYLTERVRRLVRFALSADFTSVTQEERRHTQILNDLPQNYINTGPFRVKAQQTTPLANRVVGADAAVSPVPAGNKTTATTVEVDQVKAAANAPDTLPDEENDNSPDPRLLLLSVGTNAPHILRRRQTRIGRNLDNDIVVDSDRASRYHAEIVREGEGFMLLDKGSRNGVWLNGSRIVISARIKPGDHLRIGKHEFTFVIQDQPINQPRA